jgi:hypothetical protein
VVLGVAVVTESLAGRPVSGILAGGWLAPLVTVAIMTPFFWWTMHFLLAGRVRWRAAAVGDHYRDSLRRSRRILEVLLLGHDHH